MKLTLDNIYTECIDRAECFSTVEEISKIYEEGLDNPYETAVSLLNTSIKSADKQIKEKESMSGLQIGLLIGGCFVFTPIIALLVAMVWNADNEAKRQKAIRTKDKLKEILDELENS